MSTLSLGERVVRSAWRIAPQRTLSGIVGWGARRKLPRPFRAPLLKSFARKYEIDLAEAEWPLDQYTSLHEFFTRKLRPGARLLASEADAVVAPSDGVVCDAGVVSAGKLLEAKGSVFTLSNLLADGELAARLEGGAVLGDLPVAARLPSRPRAGEWQDSRVDAHPGPTVPGGKPQRCS